MLPLHARQNGVLQNMTEILVCTAGKRRIVMIDGHPVLTTNNYDINDSSNSISVFDLELKGELLPTHVSAVVAALWRPTTCSNTSA